jgi:hypothetical protein
VNKIRLESNAATISQQATQFITITDPNHPHYGQKFMILGTQRGQNPKVLVQLPNGKRVRIPQKWTDYVQPPDDNANSNNEHLLDLHGLVKVVKMIERLKKEGNF